MKSQKEKDDWDTILTLAHKDYEKGLNSHAFFKTHNSDTGQDLVQDTFMKTWKYLIKGGKIDLMRAFLYHILNNLIVDHYRKHKSTSLDILIDKGFEPSIDDNFENIADDFDGKAAIFLINRLPKKYQKMIKMRYLQDLSLEEMATLTGQSKNTIAVQVHRGLKKLKILYKSNEQKQDNINPLQKL